MNATATKTATTFRPFCDAGRNATPASDPAAASGYADGLAGKFEPWRWDGADSIVYKAAHASGSLDRETATRPEFLPYRVRRIEGGKYVADLIRFAPSMERAVSDAREIGPEWKDAGLLVEPCEDPRKNEDGSWKCGPNAPKRVSA